MLHLTGAELSIAQYTHYLSLQLRLHAPLEAGLARHLPADWIELRLRKSEWLRADLRALGVDPAPDAQVAADIDSWPRALGTLYVLEGSTLGLQVVRKKLQDAHPAAQGAGRFMLGYGPDTGRHWLQFLARLETLPLDSWPDAEEAAAAVFTTFLNGFSQADCCLA
jgi:heme oxygenase